MKLFFQFADGSEKLIADVETEDEANKALQEFLDSQNISPPYMRYWGNPEKGVYCDYGSHSGFIVLRYDD